MKYKLYTDNQLKWLKRYVDTELRSVRRAVDKVETKTKEDKASANEFRGQLKDQAGTFITRVELWGAVIAAAGITLAIMNYLK
jgi:regulator of protease activity HflC (stomatin/prohibitin superfamily)